MSTYWTYKETGAIYRAEEAILCGTLKDGPVPRLTVYYSAGPKKEGEPRGPFVRTRCNFHCSFEPLPEARRLELISQGFFDAEPRYPTFQVAVMKKRPVEKTTDCPQTLEAYPLPGENIPYPNKTNIGGPDGN